VAFPIVPSSFSLKVLNRPRITSVVLIDILNDYIFIGLFVNGVLSIGDGVGFKKLMLLLLFDVGMLSEGAGWQFLKLIPIVDYFIAAGPPFLGVMEDGFAGVVPA